MRIMVTGGGTGGHTSPAVAVLEELYRRDPRLMVQWVGRSKSIEERISGSMSIPFRSLPVEGWPRSKSPRRLWVGVKLAWSAAKAWRYLKKFNPQLVFGVGGYVSLPLMWTAQRMGIPTVIHEQNQLLGVANRLLAPKATRIFLSFPETRGNYPKETARLVGNPVRAAFKNPPDKREARQALELELGVPVVLVTGGSQGAKRLNEAVMEMLPQFNRGELQLIWATGNADAARAHKAAEGASTRIVTSPFIQDMATACAAADVMVCRSGASTTAEIAMMRKPSVLIPFPFATDNHQEHNAKAFEDAGAAVLVRDSECTGERLGGILRTLLPDSNRLAAMASAAGALAKPDAAEAIADEILSIVFSREQGAGLSRNPQ
ncbi:MAG: undecaprenyldiphospho-muramoylpentapeptide beta-N-acetylglucosaminyltransferase [Candidatus Hydrogenedentes bacterium]|nr:undecaprenyldiphospho-muramoylpentapeptide beta-N-acetylglucosaminyltransferase [Candidatus Hydrogenedentota bacterium]